MEVGTCGRIERICIEVDEGLLAWQRDENSYPGCSWGRVLSGVPQGSVLAPIMFQIYINDMQEGLKSYINLFADDAKLEKVVRGPDDCMELQRDIDKMYEWSVKWKLQSAPLVLAPKSCANICDELSRTPCIHLRKTAMVLAR